MTRLDQNLIRPQLLSRFGRSEARPAEWRTRFIAVAVAALTAVLFVGLDTATGATFLGSVETREPSVFEPLPDPAETVVLCRVSLPELVADEATVIAEAVDCQRC